MSSDFKFRLQHALNADFLIDRELGGGGMSRVFLATERALQRRVVIKVMPPELAAGVNVERFKREIQLAAQLQHPHVVPLLATGDQDGILWFSMPFIDGESLRGTLNREKRLPPRDVVRILHDVVDALAYSHSRGIVHRDIKPDNILTSGMHALVTDFGVAKALTAASPMVGGTTTGMAIGTPAYMAPEQLAADPAADHRVDIYAVGLLAYELLTGRSPFGGSSPQATMAAQLTETPKPPHQFADIPEALSTLIMHCLEKDSAKRPQSAQALLAELDALPLMQVSGATGAVRHGKRNWIAAAAALVLVAGTYLVAQRVRNAPPGTSLRTALFGAPSADTLTARDAGPGGSRTPVMEVAQNAAAKSPAVKPETVVVYRNSPDSDAGIQVPIIISRAESLAIVAAYQKRTAVAESIKAAARGLPASASMSTSAPSVTAPGGAMSPLTPKPSGALNTQTRIMVKSGEDIMTLDRAQLVAEVGKIFADSVAIAFSRMDPNFARDARAFQFEMARPTTGRSITPQLAPVSDGRSRVVISNFTNATGKSQFFSVGREIARYLRKALPADRFDVVSDEITDRATRGGSDQISLGWGLRSDYVVSGIVTQRGDSIVLMTMFNDVRDPRFSRVNEVVAPINDPQKAFEPSLARVNSWLDTAKVFRARRVNMPRPPGGPGGEGGRGPGGDRR